MTKIEFKDIFVISLKKDGDKIKRITNFLNWVILT